MFTRFSRKTLSVSFVMFAIALAACAPAATPAVPAAPAPALAPTNPPAPTAMPAPTTAPEPTAAPTAAPTEAASMAKPVTLQMGNNDTLGKFISDGDGNTLYLFTKDIKGTSNCYDKCAQAWPPVIPDGAPTLKDGVDTALISTTLRTDGSTQLTYNGWPLYYYFKDKAPGDTTGQAVNDVWWVVSGEGNPIKPASVALTQTEKLGNVLIDGGGMALYLFTKDAPGVSNCYGKCETAWPPLLTLDQPTLGDNVTSSLISTTVRKDGSVQLHLQRLAAVLLLQGQSAG